MEERSKTMDEIICTDAIEMSYVFYLYLALGSDPNVSKVELR